MSPNKSRPSSVGRSDNLGCHVPEIVSDNKYDKFSADRNIYEITYREGTVIALSNPLAMSLRTLMKGVAPIPSPINKIISYLE